MLIDFLKTQTTKSELETALRVLREFKELESKEEWLRIPFDCWAVFEWYEEYLAHLAVGEELKPETKAELAKLA